MIDINQYVGKKVSVIDDDGRNVCGEAVSIGYDDEADKDYLLIDVVKYHEMLYEEDIASIEVIEE